MSALPTLAYSPDDAAAALGVSRRTISRLLRSRAIKAKKSGRRTLVTADSLKRYLDGLPDAVPETVFGERAHVRPMEHSPNTGRPRK
jgi:excisionase family DNA binding protein